jgi:hypothetical protein
VSGRQAPGTMAAHRREGSISFYSLLKTYSHSSSFMLLLCLHCYCLFICISLNATPGTHRQVLMTMARAPRASWRHSASSSRVPSNLNAQCSSSFSLVRNEDSLNRVSIAFVYDDETRDCFEFSTCTLF